MEELISVVVPIYRVEPYLDKCISSIVNQTYRNLEIILVDDGSPDNCPAICDSWAERDDRIKVIHKPNGGAGSARNAGLNEVHGSWFTFVDGDDYIASWAYERMAGFIAEDVDVIECTMRLTFDDMFPFDEKTSDEVVRMNAEQAMSAHISDAIFRQTPPNKIYRASEFRDILFPTNTLIDDEFWTYQIIGKSKKLVHIPDVLYAYRQHETSAMHRSFSLGRLQMLDARYERLKYVTEHFPTLRNKAEIGLWGSCLFSYQMALSFLPVQERTLAHEKVETILSRIPPNINRFQALSLMQKIWWVMSKCSLSGTCKVRNLLRIGL